MHIREGEQSNQMLVTSEKGASGGGVAFLKLELKDLGSSATLAVVALPRMRATSWYTKMGRRETGRDLYE